MLFCYIVIVSLASIINLQGNARVINYTGIIRGATQRLVKQEMYGMPNDKLAQYLSDILAELSGEEGEYQLAVLPDDTYQHLLYEMRESWQQLQAEIEVVRDGGDKKRLFALSEDYFDLADRTVSAAERYSEKRVDQAKGMLICLNLGFILLFALFWIYGLRQKKVHTALNKAESANRAKSEFLSRMSHEIRTPMNGIIGMTAIARMSVDNREKLLDCLKKIDLSSSYLLALINDVLDMSRIESGKLEITPEPFSLRALIESLTCLYYAQAADKQIHFETVLVGDIPTEMYGDSLRLNQILANLISNALKFTPGGGTVRLRVIRQPDVQGAARFRFEVSDTGCGIDKQNFSKIFEAFEQENDSVVRTFGGTGLGLSIVKRLSEMMGGGVSVQSRLGEGSTFSVDLPIEVMEQPAARTDFDGMSALVAVGDDEDRRATCARLSDMGMKVFPAADGDQLSVLLELDDVLKAGLCIIDDTLPGTERLEAVRRARQSAGEGPVMLVATYDTSGLEESARRAGADEVLTKPLFRSAIEAALIRIRQGDSLPDLPKTAVTNYSFTGKHILLAEDNEINREIALELLGATGALIDEARDGQEAVAKFEASSEGYYDLILMDIQMPKMNGYEATEHIRAMDRPDADRVPIFAMTANAFVEDIEKSRLAGMTAHISKPLDIAAIYKQLDALFHVS